MIGEGALSHELYRAGFIASESEPDFVVLGETRSYGFDIIYYYYADDIDAEASGFYLRPENRYQEIGYESNRVQAYRQGNSERKRGFAQRGQVRPAFEQ